MGCLGIGDQIHDCWIVVVIAAIHSAVRLRRRRMVRILCDWNQVMISAGSDGHSEIRSEQFMWFQIQKVEAAGFVAGEILF